MPLPWWALLPVSWWAGMIPAAWICGAMVRGMKADARPPAGAVIVAVILWPLVIIAAPIVWAFGLATAKKGPKDGNAKR